jgi:hypothetical protein
MLTCDVCISPGLAPHIASRPMKNNFFARIISLTSVDMAASKCNGGNEEELINLVGKVLDNDNECSNFSEDEIV